MYSTVENLLADDEELLLTANPSIFSAKYFNRYAVSFLIAVAVSAVLVYGYLNLSLPVNPLYGNLLTVLILLYVLKLEVRRRFTMYHMTNFKIIQEKGILNKKWVSINYHQVTHVDMKQNFEERIFGVSNLHIATAGESTRELDMEGMKHSHDLKQRIMERARDSSTSYDNQSNAGNQDNRTDDLSQ